ncbi:hypothetical protein [Nocardiopsis quinghaiensis]|uniref:hypothetical protein n=1 Tax=Nocardiopsis quinghaiensis TaxID=464995 RepID=UPI001CC2380A|nr:hypothetical protein [Nocardiopsis quinghaiensis]
MVFIGLFVPRGALDPEWLRRLAEWLESVTELTGCEEFLRNLRKEGRRREKPPA